MSKHIGPYASKMNLTRMTSCHDGFSVLMYNDNTLHSFPELLGGCK
jgi:hypothetical protein